MCLRACILNNPIRIPKKACEKTPKIYDFSHKFFRLFVMF